MDRQISPLQCKTHDFPAVTASVTLPDRFACLSPHSAFAIGTLTDNLRLRYEHVCEDSRVAGGGWFGADYACTAMWATHGYRDIAVADVANKRVVRQLVSNSGNAQVISMGPIDAEKAMAVMTGTCVLAMEPMYAYAFYTIVPIGTGEEPFVTGKRPVHSFFVPIGGDQLLSFTQGKKAAITWQKVHYANKQLQEIPGDPFAKQLTEKQLRPANYCRAINRPKRLMVASLLSLDKPLIARWDNDKGEVKIEPLLLQLPKELMFTDNWLFSPDGNWCRATATVDLDKKTERDIILFYHVNPKYPGCLSLPALGEATSGNYREDNYGCFVNHSRLGMVYLDINPAGEAVIYRMSDVLAR